MSIDLDKRSKILLGVLAVIVVAAAAFFLLKGGSSSGDTATGPVTVPTKSTTATATATPKASVTPSPPAPVASGSSTRDPFEPLAEEAAATTTTSPAAVVVSPTPAASAAPTPTITTGAHTVTLVSITGTTAVLTVDGGDDKSVKAGGAVGSGVACIKITDDSVFVTYNSKAYALAPGQTISV